MLQSDTEIDEAARADLIHQIGAALVEDSVMLPLFQFPNIAAWRTDAIEGDAPADGRGQLPRLQQQLPELGASR